MLYEAEQRKAQLKATLNDSGGEEPKAVAAATPASWLQLRGQVKDKIEDEKERADKIKDRLGDNERMLLHKISQNNRYFLFEDRQQRIFKIYELKNQTAEERKKEELEQGEYKAPDKILEGSLLFSKDEAKPEQQAQPAALRT